MNKWLACALVAVTSGCPDIKTDPNETSAPPSVEFDPGNSIIPFPNNLLIDQMTGKVNVPAGCNESAATKATRELVLNKLDGFGTFETAMSVTLTAPIDPASITADNIVLFKSAADPSTSNPIPVAVIPGSSIRFATRTENADGSLTCSDPNPIDSITIVPRVPLDQKSNYIVALKSGLLTDTGEPFTASFTWSLVRQPENPVTVDDNGIVVSDRTPLDPASEDDLASLLGIDLLWKAHAPVLQFLEAKGHSRDDVLLAWSFKTQTTTDALDPAVAGTPLTQLNDVPITGPVDQVPSPLSVAAQVAQARAATAFPYQICNTGVPTMAAPEPDNIQCFLKVALGGGSACNTAADPAMACATAFVIGTATCALAGCANVGDVQVGRINSPQFQANLPNPIDANKPIPGPWADPVKPTKVEDEQLNVFIFIPTGTQPAGGWPTAVFQHGLGRASTDVFAIGGSLARDPDGAGTAASGIATVAINAVAHGDRRVQIKNTDECAAAPLPSSCFGGFLSADLGGTRDNIRQTIVDHQQLIAALKKCTGGQNNCGTFVVDPAHIVYIGQSLGGILGGLTTAVSADLKASVLNVPGVGWADIFENTDTLAIRCLLVDGLIDAGTLVGDKSDLTAMPPTGLCTTDAWKTQPGYRTFAAIGRWVLDPADPANFTVALATKKTMIQEVNNDQVVPNIATMNEAALLGRTAAAARTNTTPPPGAPQASDDVATNPTASKYVRYTNVAPNLGAGFPGNTYSHGSLLAPATSVNATAPTDVCTAGTPQFCDGVMGTLQMVVDAISWLQVNK